MAPFVVRRIVHAPAERVWAVLSDFANHSQWVPLTKIIADPGDPRVGWSFTAATGVGPGCLRDKMTIDLWEPPTREQPTRPARYRVSKRGPVFGGWVNVQVTSLGGVIGPSSSEVVCTEDLRIRVPVLGRALSPLIEPLGKAAYGHALDRMLASAIRHRG